MTPRLISSTFVLSLFLGACGNPAPPPPAEEICNNEIDDDGDGGIDCDDADCNAVCPSFERCDDGADNDLDGLFDCNDPDCVPTPDNDVCAAPEVCDDAIDNDADGDLDCADVDCAFEPACPPPPNQAQLDLNDGGSGLLNLSENIVGGGFFGHPTEAGDVNNDGFIDVVSCAITADFGNNGDPNFKNAPGAVTVFLSEGVGSIDGLRLPGDANTVRILGERALDFLGASAHVADINGDDFDDIILGAQGYDGSAADRPMVGAVYVIFGAATLPATIDLSQNPPGVLRIVGERTGDRLGIWVGAGDLNADGVQDLLLGADQHDGALEDRSNAGITYLINGLNLPQTELDLATVQSLSSDLLFAQILGNETGDHLGGTLFGGDVDGDGKGDIAVAATMDRLSASIADDSLGEEAVGNSGADGPGNTRSLAGDVHVIFGPISGTIDLAEANPTIDDVIIFGAAEGDHLGEEIVLIDMDNDGSDEILLGALTVNRPGAFAVGATYIIPGGPAFRALPDIDMLTPPAGVITFLGDEQGEISGDTLAAPDLDGDGIRELAVARPSRTVRRDGVNVFAAGRITVFYDVASLPALVDLRAVNNSFSFVEILGIDEDDTLAYSMTSGDVDGDGKEDLLPNVMRGDGPDNQFLDAGEIFVISGARASALIGR
jgi:FG-GAP repeat